MTKLKFSREEFEKEIKLSEDIIEKISLFGTPLEKIDKNKVEIEIFPNRPDLISLQGYLRGFNAFLGRKTGLKNYKIHKAEKNYKVKIDSSVKSIRPFTACAIVKNLKLNKEEIESIIDLQEKLHITIGRNRKKLAIGIYPLEKIKLPIKYEAKKASQIKFMALGSDKEMSAMQILQKHPTGRQYSHLLENKEKFPVFVDSNKKILSMPPIINSQDTGRLNPDTKDVFIECSGFDLNLLKKVLNIIVTSLAELGGAIYQMKLDYGKIITTPDLSNDKIKISLDNVNKLLGLSLKEKDIHTLLSKMGYEYKKPQVLVPTYRTDILHEVDIIEDIAIAYGYDKFIPELPQISTIAEESKESKLKNKISNILTGLGFLEVSSYHLLKQDEAKKTDDKSISLEDSKTDYKYLRPNLLLQSLKILGDNTDKEYPQKIFEIGTIFSQDTSQETGIKEQENLIVSIAPGNFTNIKQILNYLIENLDLKFNLDELKKKELIDGRAAKITLSNKEIGYIGEIHPNTLRKWHIKMPISILEISLEEFGN